jgi:diketogulonate reductase-like aldo/keto reductase
MIALPKTKVRNKGISNFSPHQLRKLISSTGVTPFAHQMELHPYLQQSAWLTAHQALGISVTAYSPLANSNPIYDSSPRATPPPLLQNDLVGRIAEKRNCTPAQVALSWGIGRGTSVIPKSSHVEHIRENFAASACELKAEDLAEIKLMERDYVKRFSNPSENWGVTLFEGLEDA